MLEYLRRPLLPEALRRTLVRIVALPYDSHCLITCAVFAALSLGNRAQREATVSPCHCSGSNSGEAPGYIVGRVKSAKLAASPMLRLSQNHLQWPLVYQA